MESEEKLGKYYLSPKRLAKNLTYRFYGIIVSSLIILVAFLAVCRTIFLGIDNVVWTYGDLVSASETVVKDSFTIVDEKTIVKTYAYADASKMMHVTGRWEDSAGKLQKLDEKVRFPSETLWQHLAHYYWIELDFNILNYTIFLRQSEDFFKADVQKKMAALVLKQLKENKPVVVTMHDLDIPDTSLSMSEFAQVVLIFFSVILLLSILALLMFSFSFTYTFLSVVPERSAKITPRTAILMIVLGFLMMYPMCDGWHAEDLDASSLWIFQYVIYICGATIFAIISGVTLKSLWKAQKHYSKAGPSIKYFIVMGMAAIVFVTIPLIGFVSYDYFIFCLAVLYTALFLCNRLGINIIMSEKLYLDKKNLASTSRQKPSA